VMGGGSHDMGGVRFNLYASGGMSMQCEMKYLRLPLSVVHVPSASNTFNVGRHQGNGFKALLDWEKTCQAYQGVSTHMMGYLLSLSFKSLPVNM
jgi:hypothetical protein